jgi:hypothetical protein
VLERRLREELAMPVTDSIAPEDPATVDGRLALVHLRVEDADRAMRFFSEAFGWVGERYADAHVSYYVLNTAVTVRLLDDPDAAPIRPNYAVRDVAAAVSAIEAAGGRVTEAQTAPDGGGWAFAEDREGVPLLVFRSDRAHPSSDVPVSGDVGLAFIKEDATAVAEFYGGVLGWTLRAPHPGGDYFDAVEHVGIWDENASLGTDHPASISLFLDVPALRPAVARIEALGGSSELLPEATTMGPYFSVACTDDQGTAFGLISAALDPR